MTDFNKKLSKCPQFCQEFNENIILPVSVDLDQKMDLKVRPNNDQDGDANFDPHKPKSDFWAKRRGGPHKISKSSTMSD